MNFMDLKLTLWLINKTIENENKEKKHTFNSVDDGFDKHFTTNKTNSNNNWCLTNYKGEIYRGSYNWFHGFKIAFMTHKQNHRNKNKE